MNCTILAAISTDGFIADSDEVSVPTSSEDHQLLRKLLLDYPVHIMGRKTFERHSRRSKNDKKRIVFTSKPEKYAKKYPFVHFTDASVTTVLQNTLQPCLILGGSNVYAKALQSGLVTDVILVIEPTQLRSGIPLLYYSSLQTFGYTLQKQDCINAKGTKVYYYKKN